MITLVDLLPPIQAGVRGACFVWRGRDLTSSPRRRQKSLKNVPLDWYEHAPPRRTHHLTICIHCSERDMSPPSEVLLNLSGCPELQGVRIWTMPPVKSDMALVSSITSTSLRKVAFLSRWNIPSDPLLRDPCWQHIDDLVCDLVNRLRLLGYQHILEAEIRSLESMGSKERLDDGEFQPKFMGRDRVKIFEGRSGKGFLLS